MTRDRWFQVHWSADHIENVYVRSIEEAFRHAYDTLRLDLADETFPVNWPLRIEAMDTGLGYDFDDTSFIVPPERAIAFAQQLDAAVAAGAFTKGLTREDADAISAARRAILRHLEGYDDIDFRGVAEQLAEVLERHHSNLGFARRSIEEPQHDAE